MIVVNRHRMERVTEYLRQCRTAKTRKEIGEALGVSTSAIVRTLDCLEVLGQVVVEVRTVQSYAQARACRDKGLWGKHSYSSKTHFYAFVEKDAPKKEASMTPEHKERFSPTGRLSRYRPHLQNTLPYTEEGKRWAELFREKTGLVFGDMGFRGIEMEIYRKYSPSHHTPRTCATCGCANEECECGA